MEHAIKIRSAAIGDYDQLCALWDCVDDLHRDALPALFRVPPEPPRKRELVERQTVGPDSTILVAETAGQVVGTVTMLLRRMPESSIRHARQFAEIDMLAVAPIYRRRGIGRRLIDAGFAWATGQGTDCIEVVVFEFNDAAAGLYRSAGFQTSLRRLTIFPSRENAKVVK